MAQPNVLESPSQPPADPQRALKILAKSIFKQLKSQGYDSKQIVGLATELISQVTSDLAHDTDSSR